jgi:hypothetical protein
VTRPGIETHTGAVRQRFGDSSSTCRVLLVGEINPYGSEPEFALYCAPAASAGGRLQRLVLDLPRWAYLGIWRANLCVGSWDAAEARVRAAELAHGDRPWEVIVGLGVKVAEALRQTSVDSEKWEPFTTRRVFQLQGADRTVITLPHPSGRNAATWARDGARERARELVRAAAPELWAAPTAAVGA